MNTLFRDIFALLPGGEIKKCCVYVRDNVIASMDTPPEGFCADTVIDGKNRLLIPGLVNSHTHAYMTMFRSCADDLSFSDWLFGHISPLEDKMTAEDCYWATLLAYAEMISTGTTSSLDMYVFIDTAVRAAEEAGVRAVLSRGLAGGADDEAGGERRIREAMSEISAGRGTNPRLSFMLAPHAPYSCDEGYLRKIAELAGQEGLGINVHLAESRSETDTVRERYGCTPCSFLYRTGILTERTVAAHCVYLDEGDIELMAECRVSAATNPVSNLKLGNGIAPIPKLLEAGVNVCLGTDGAASNNALNMFREMGFVGLLHKGVSGDARTVSARQTLDMATVCGARALGLDGVGEIKPGAKADLAVINMDKPWLRPHNSMLSSLVYSANGSEVESVMADGKFLMLNGELTTIDLERVYYETDRTCKRLGLLRDI